MSIKQTGALQILTDQSFTEHELLINPNDGFDLGLIVTEATVNLEFNFNSETSDPIVAQLIQKNECRPGALKLGNKNDSKLNKGTNIRLTLKDSIGYPKLIIGPA